MMKKKPVLAVFTFCVLSLGLTKGAFAVMSTINTYSGVCGPLDGFPGLLQKAGFVPSGGCRAINGGTLDKCRHGICKVNGKLGHCVGRLIDRKPYCECRPDRVSQ